MGFKYAIGIDPGQKSGLVRFNLKTKEFDFIKTTDFFGVYEYVLSQKPKDCILFIEAHYLLPAIFGKYTAFMKGPRGVMQGLPIVMKIAKNIGSNNREASLLVEGIRKKGFTVIEYVAKEPKWNSECVAEYLGANKRMSEHCRDAIRAVIRGLENLQK